MTKAKTSVAAYFKKQYPKHPLKHLNLPCVGIGSKGCAYQLSDTSFSILMLNPGPTQFSVDDYGKPA